MSSAAWSSAPTRRKGAQTAERILDAAEALFAERGYAGTHLRDVAGRAGLRTPSLYNHFESKEALYAAVLARGIGPVLELLSELAEAAAQAEGAPDPEEVVTRVMELLVARPLLARLVQHETLSGGRHLSPMLREWLAPTFARAIRMVELSPAARRWKREQLPLLVLAMVHVVVGSFTVAPLLADLGLEELSGGDALARQTRFLRDLAATLFSAPSPPARSPRWT